MKNIKRATPVFAAILIICFIMQLLPTKASATSSKIEVFEKLEKYSRTAGNLIVIHYAFQLPEENGMPIVEKILPKQAKTA